jgi:drug/metabolite transporter (DMT)-like permease
MPPVSRQRALSAAAAAVIIWGVSFIATKIALREAEPLVVIWIRFGVGVLVLGLIVAVRREFARPSVREIGQYVLLGLVGITVHQWLQSTGLTTAQASTTAWVVSASPIFIALLAWAFLHEPMERGRVLGILIAASGVLLVVSRGNIPSLVTGSFYAPGDPLILCSAVTWALFSVLSRKALAHHFPCRLIFFVMLSGWILTTVLMVLTGRTISGMSLSRDAFVAMLFLGVFCSGIAYILWFDALHHLPAPQVGSLLFIEPLVTVGAAALVLGETITMSSLLGGGIVLAGVWLVTRQRHRMA